MSKKARLKSSTGIYHVLLQSLSDGNVFTKEEDYSQFLENIRLTSDRLEFVVYAFCLTPRQVHLLLKVPVDAVIGLVISPIIVTYALYINSINSVPCSLFQTPFKSEVVETDDCFLRTVWNIHKDPVEQHIVTKVEDYPWSSYPLFLNTIQSGKEQTKYTFLDTSFVLGMFTTPNEFVEFMKEEKI
jgi:putative transposase